MKHSRGFLLLVSLIALAGCAPLQTMPAGAPAAVTTPVQAPAVETISMPALAAATAPAAPATGTPLPAAPTGAPVTTVPTRASSPAASTAPAAAATPQRASAPAAGCPGPTEDLQRLIVPEHGYCLAYPAQYKVEKASPSLTALVIGGSLNSGDTHMHITVKDTQGVTLEEAAQRLEADYNVGFDPKRSATTVAGEPGVVFDGLTGEDINRRVLFVHDGALYELYFAPSSPSNADLQARLEVLYKQVIGSFTFIPRSASIAGSVDDCLSPTSTTRLLTDRKRGFCLLYPADFMPNESAGGTLALAAGPSGGDNRSKVVVEVKDAGGKTAEQLADELVAAARRASPGLRVDRPFGLTIGYEPVQLLEGVPAPEPELSRQVLAVHDGKLYHLTFTPADPFGDKEDAQAQALYDLVVRSFRFITPGH